VTTDAALLERLQALWREPSPDNLLVADDDGGLNTTGVDSQVTEELCTPDDDILGVWPPKPSQWCPLYAHRRGWRSIYGSHLICGKCHPPASEAVVDVWIDAADSATS
jgi:hypothetical protein